MGKIYEGLDGKLREFIAQQHLFFVATAPLEQDGLVNLSPKGLDSLRILDSRRVAYLDLTGSGVETIAHLRQNGRIVLMFCAFEGKPRIVRLHGRGSVRLPGDPQFEELAAQYPPYPGTRAVIDVEVSRISDSCGFGVPLFQYTGERSQLEKWCEGKGEEGLAEYREKKNALSIDGLPALNPDGNLLPVPEEGVCDRPANNPFDGHESRGHRHPPAAHAAIGPPVARPRARVAGRRRLPQRSG